MRFLPENSPTGFFLLFTIGDVDDHLIAGSQFGDKMEFVHLNKVSTPIERN